MSSSETGGPSIIWVPQNADIYNHQCDKILELLKQTFTEVENEALFEVTVSARVSMRKGAQLTKAKRMAMMLFHGKLLIQA
jgi:hypothetical protein